VGFFSKVKSGPKKIDSFRRIHIDTRASKEADIRVQIITEFGVWEFIFPRRLSQSGRIHRQISSNSRWIYHQAPRTPI
jgi:hypothetical protein